MQFRSQKPFHAKNVQRQLSDLSYKGIKTFELEGAGFFIHEIKNPLLRLKKVYIFVCTLFRVTIEWLLKKRV